MNINFKQIDYYLDNHQSHLYFFLLGDDDGQITYITKKLLTHYFYNTTHNVVRINSRDLHKDLSLLDHHFQSLQLFSEKKAIIIENMIDNLKESCLTFVNNNKSNFLLIIQAANIKKSSKIYKDFQSFNKFCFINCYKLDFNTTVHFIKSFLTKHRIHFDNNMVNLIASSLPDNLLIINNELKKIVQYLCHENKLSIEIIRSIVSGAKDLEYINILHALICKNSNQLLNQLHKLNDVSLLKVIRRIQQYLGKIISIKNFETKYNQDLNLVIDHFKPPIFFKEKSIILEVCKKMNHHEALEFMGDLISLEIKYKTSPSIIMNLELKHYLLQKSATVI